MAIRIDDRWLWLGLGAFTFLAAKGVAHGLRAIIELTEVHEPSPAPPPAIPIAALDPHVGKESAIKTSSLETLATCPNIEIRKAATKILCERFFAHQLSRERLLKELGSSNERVQHRAQLAFNMLCDYGVVQQHVMPSTPPSLRPRPSGLRRNARGLPINAREHTSEAALERDLRRRRREAMVINEGDRPVSQEDVYMRDRSGRMSSELEREARESMEEGTAVGLALAERPAPPALGVASVLSGMDSSQIRDSVRAETEFFANMPSQNPSPDT